jgi:hypothetical protein
MTTRSGAISAARRDISPATVAILVAVPLAIVAAVVVVDEVMMTTIGGPNLLEGSYLIFILHPFCSLMSRLSLSFFRFIICFIKGEMVSY